MNRAQLNYLNLSTAIEPQPWRPRRYLSASHAVGTYIKNRAYAEGLQGINFEHIACKPENTDVRTDDALVGVLDDIFLFEDAVRALQKRVTPRAYHIWVVVRVKGMSYREVEGISSSQAHRICNRVDGELEAQLDRLGLLVHDAVGEMWRPKPRPPWGCQSTGQ